MRKKKTLDNGDDRITIGIRWWYLGVNKVQILYHDFKKGHVLATNATKNQKKYGGKGVLCHDERRTAHLLRLEVLGEVVVGCFGIAASLQCVWTSLFRVGKQGLK